MSWLQRDVILRAAASVWKGKMPGMRKAILWLTFAGLAGAQPSTDDVLRQARQAMGGSHLAAVESLSISGKRPMGPSLAT